MPHIRARTIEDLWFGQGYCHGQDRLWQMELYRLSSSGRISEIAGQRRVAERPPDAHARDAPGRRSAEAGLDPALRGQLEATSAGVNAAAEAAPALPAAFQILRRGFDPWRPVDMLTAMKLLAFGLSTNWSASCCAPT